MRALFEKLDKETDAIILTQVGEFLSQYCRYRSYIVVNRNGNAETYIQICSKIRKEILALLKEDT